MDPSRWPRCAAPGAARWCSPPRDTPLRQLWALVYRAVAHAVGMVLTRGEPGAAVYTRASFGGSEFLPGLSDVDLAIVLATDAQADRARGRWKRHERARCRRRAGRPAAHLRGGGAAGAGRHVGPDLRRGGVRRAAGRRATPCGRCSGPSSTAGRSTPGGGCAVRIAARPARPSGVQERRIAAWLELVYWWRFAFPACAGAARPVAGQPLREARGRAGADLARARARRAARDARGRAAARCSAGCPRRRPRCGR